MTRSPRTCGYNGPLLAAWSAMGRPTVYAEALKRAAAAIGGEDRLAAVLHVPIADMRGWLQGEAYPPSEIYQHALDLLISVGRN